MKSSMKYIRIKKAFSNICVYNFIWSESTQLLANVHGVLATYPSLCKALYMTLSFTTLNPHLIFPQCNKESIIIPILSMEKLKLREIKLVNEVGELGFELRCETKAPYSSALVLFTAVSPHPKWYPGHTVYAR